MGRFYFHIKEGGRIIRDHEGTELPDMAVAREQAVECARELWAEAIKSGQDMRADAFVIADEEAKQVMVVPLLEALPQRLRRPIVRRRDK